MSDEKEKYPKRNWDELMNDPDYREKLLNAMCVYAGPENPTTNSMNMMMVYAGPTQMNKGGLTGFTINQQMEQQQQAAQQAAQQAQQQAQQQAAQQQQAQELKQAQENGEMPKFCPNCGRPLTFKGRFCSECGGKLFV